ncbi:unnamed protein product [Closterium sp. NIES-53]
MSRSHDPRIALHPCVPSTHALLYSCAPLLMRSPPPCSPAPCSFVVDFLQKQFPRGDVPQWVQAAMQTAAIDISPALHPARVL